MAIMVVFLMLMVPLATLVPEQSDARLGGGDTYTYTLAYDSSKMSSDQTTNSALSVADRSPILHPSYDGTSTSGYGSWTWDTTTGKGPFNSFYAAFDMTRGNTFYAVLNPFDLTKTIDGTSLSPISNYNIMWVLPKVYISSSSTSLTLSSESTSGGTAYAHTIGGHEYEYIAIGVYEGATKNISGKTVLTSASGVNPTVDKTRAQFRSYAHNYTMHASLGSNAYSMQWNFYQWELYKYCSWTLMENFNSQAVVGGGHVRGSTHVFQTGATNTSGPYAGTPLASAADINQHGNDQVKMFIEGAWGGVREYVDGVVVNGSSGYYVDTKATPNDATTTGTYVQYFADSLPTTEGYPTSIVTSRTQTWGMGGSSTTTTENRGLTDYIYASASGQYGFNVGGNAHTDATTPIHYGLSYVAANDAMSVHYDNLGSRLAFVFDELYDVSVVQGENGTTTIADGVIKCAAGYQVTFNNAPASGYRLKDVTINKVEDDSDVSESVSLTKTLTSGTFTMPAYDVNVKPTYEAVKTLTFSNNTGGSITVSSSPTGYVYDTHTIMALPDKSVTIVEEANHTSGTMTIADYILGADVTYTIAATPGEGYFFKGFFNGDTELTDTTVAEITGVDGSATVNASFYRYTVTFDPESDYITVDSTYHADGDTVTLTASPLTSGYRLKSLEGSYLVGETVTALIFTSKTLDTSIFTMPAADVTINAVFEEIVSIEIGKNGLGTVAITGSGTTSPIIVKIDGEYTINGTEATISDIELGVPKTYTITASPDAGHEFKWFFDGNMHQITGTGASVSTLANKLCAEFTPHSWSTHVQGSGTATEGGYDSGSPSPNTTVTITCDPGIDMKFDSIAAWVIGSGDPITLTEETPGTSPVYSFTMPNDSVWVEVVFVDDNVTITFNMNGHGTQIQPITVLRNHATTAPEDPTADRCDFDGWFTDSALTDQWDFSSVVPDSMVLYAKWNVDVYTVTFMVDGSVYDTKQTNSNWKLSGMPASPSKAGYNFTGWYPQGSDNKITTGTVFTDDTTVYAQWYKHTPTPSRLYTITIESGEGGSASQSVVKVSPGSTLSAEGSALYVKTGQSVREIDAVPDMGYRFAGWSVTEATVISNMKIELTFAEVDLVSISIQTAPNKITYNQGDTFDPNGIVLSLKYSDGSEWDLRYRGNESSFTFSPSLEQSLNPSDKHVLITYEGKTVQQDITVKAPPFDWIPVILLLFIIIIVILILIAAFRKKSSKE